MNKKFRIVLAIALCVVMVFPLAACENARGADDGGAGQKGNDGVGIASIDLNQDGSKITIIIKFTNNDEKILEFTVNDGLPGEPGASPEIKIGENGNWFIDGADTGTPATGSDGVTPVIKIGENGNWFIDGMDTEIPATGENGEDGYTPYIGANGNWWVNGRDTGQKALGVNGDTPKITDGCWWIGGINTGIPATGPKGGDGVSIVSIVPVREGEKGIVTITITLSSGDAVSFPLYDGGGEMGPKGDSGKGIVSITMTGSEDGVDTYTITYSEGDPTIFQVTNGKNGKDGKGIDRIELIGSAGGVDTYRVYYTDGSEPWEYTVTNGAKGDKGDPGKDGNGIASVTLNAEKSTGEVSIYTITFTDGSEPFEFEVRHGNDGAPGAGILSIDQDKENSTDETGVYVITLSNGVTYTFEVKYGNGAGTAGPVNNGKSWDYFSNVYTYLDDPDHVFEEITYEELLSILGSPGRAESNGGDSGYVILFGGAWDPEMQLMVPYINEAAKSRGISKIYNFDPKLDGGIGVEAEMSYYNSNGILFNYDNIDIFNFRLNDGITMDKMIASALGGLTDSEVLRGPYLVYYSNTASPVARGVKAAMGLPADMIVDGRLVHPNQLKAQADMRNKMTDPLRSFFNRLNPAAADNTFDIFIDKDADNIHYSLTADDQTLTGGRSVTKESNVFKFITYHSLIKMLESEGEYIICFGGLWSGDTRNLIYFMNMYARNAGVDNIYMFDPRLDGENAAYNITGLASDDGGDTGGLLNTGGDRPESTSLAGSYTKLYIHIIKYFGDNFWSGWNLPYSLDMVKSGDSSGAADVNCVTVDDHTNDGFRTYYTKICTPGLLLYNKNNVNKSGKAQPVAAQFEQKAQSWADGNNSSALTGTNVNLRMHEGLSGFFDTVIGRNAVKRTAFRPEGIVSAVSKGADGYTWSYSGGDHPLFSVQFIDSHGRIAGCFNTFRQEALFMHISGGQPDCGRGISGIGAVYEGGNTLSEYTVKVVVYGTSVGAAADKGLAFEDKVTVVLSTDTDAGILTILNNTNIVTVNFEIKAEKYVTCLNEDNEACRRETEADCCGCHEYETAVESWLIYNGRPISYWMGENEMNLGAGEEPGSYVYRLSVKIPGTDRYTVIGFYTVAV